MRCCGVILLTLISAYLSSVWPVQMSEIYTKISNGNIKNIQQAFQIVMPFGLIYLTAELLNISRRVLLDCIIAAHEAEIRENSVEKLLKMPVSYTAGCLSAERTAQLNQGVAGLSQFIKILCNDVFSSVLIAVFTLAQVMLNTNWLMGLIMLAYLSLTAIISYFQIRSQNGMREKIVRQRTSVEGHIAESITNLELIRSMNAEVYERKRLSPEIRRVSSTEREHHIFMGQYDGLKQCCKIGFQLVLLVSLLALALTGSIEASAVVTVCLLFQQLLKPVDDMYRFMDDTASCAVKIKILQELMSRPQDAVFDTPDGGFIPQGSEICLKNVIITAPGENEEEYISLAAYENLRIPTSGSIALQGSTGCGKTSLFRAIMGFYPYSQGNITLFGEEVSRYSRKELSNLLCYVPQNAFFFAGSIRDNMLYGIENEVSDDQLLDALHKACLLSELSEQNKCFSYAVLDLPVAESGKNFSGGQRQRLALARAFLRKPRLFLLDEITVGLDDSTADLVLTNLEQYAAAEHAGILHISHEERVVKRCKLIILITNLLKGSSQKEKPNKAS